MKKFFRLMFVICLMFPASFIVAFLTWMTEEDCVTYMESYKLALKDMKNIYKKGSF